MKPRNRYMVKFGSSLVLAMACALSSQLAAGGEPRYPIFDSKFPAAEAKLGWLDNERVIFHGYEVGKVGQPSPDDGHPMTETGLFIWDTTKGTVTKYWDIDGPTSLCVYHDTIAFGQRIKGEENAWKRVVGKVGQEQSVRSTGTDWVNPVSCAYSKEKPPEVTGQRIVRHLREEHGYLDFGSTTSVDRSDAAKILFYRPNEKEPLALPLNPNHILNLFEYVEFENAYLLESQRQTTYAAPVWLLKPDGTVTKIFEPIGKEWERMGWGGYHLTKKGIFLSGGRGDYASVGTRGGYLLRSSREAPSRLIAGLVRNETVSPDGCKIAFVHVLHSLAGAESFKALGQGKPGTRTLKVIDLCVGKGE
jgi:hypothetical protein